MPNCNQSTELFESTHNQITQPPNEFRIPPSSLVCTHNELTMLTNEIQLRVVHLNSNYNQSTSRSRPRPPESSRPAEFIYEGCQHGIDVYRRLT